MAPSRWATVGLLQFLAPTGHFLLATQLYGEPFTAADVTTFLLIWSALALYLSHLHRHQRALAVTSPWPSRGTGRQSTPSPTPS